MCLCCPLLVAEGIKSCSQKHGQPGGTGQDGGHGVQPAGGRTRVRPPCSVTAAPAETTTASICLISEENLSPAVENLTFRLENPVNIWNLL